MKLNLSDKAKSVIAAIAPTLGLALGGPLGGLAGNVIASSIGGGDSKAVEDALLTQKPETLLALRKAEQDFTLQLESLGIERERIAMADRVSARDMAKVDMRPQMVISAVFIGGYFMIFGMLITGAVELTQTQQTLLNVLMGALTVGIPTILSFWFGSTAGSAQKSAMLYQSKPAD